MIRFRPNHKIGTFRGRLKGTRRSVSIPPPTAGRGIDCPGEGCRISCAKDRHPHGPRPGIPTLSGSVGLGDTRESGWSRARPAKPDAPLDTQKRLNFLILKRVKSVLAVHAKILGIARAIPCFGNDLSDREVASRENRSGLRGRRNQKIT